MITTLRDITRRVELAGKRIFEANGHEYKRGFTHCHELFTNALAHTSLYAQSLLHDRIVELEQLNKSKDAMIQKTLISSGIIRSKKEEKLANDIEKKEKLLANIVAKEKRIAEMQVGMVSIAATQKKSASAKEKRNAKAMNFIKYMGLEEQFKEYQQQ